MTQKSTLSYFNWSFLFTVLGLLAGAFLGYNATGTVTGALGTAFIVGVLCVLEISLSFDNAVVNATILKDMDAKWRRRFLTWGILIAVFGMRIIFPLLIVAIAAQLGPVEAVTLAVEEPDRYAQILTDAHVGIAAFGGTFLFMVGLKFFFDTEKDTHWFAFIERRLAKAASIESIEIVLVLLALYGVSTFLGEDAREFLVAGILGMVAFVAVKGVAGYMEASQETTDGVYKSGAASFLYLELLDASFSFDGVIGAFALSNNLFVIAIGLGVGAFYVRSMTIMLVDKGTLAEYRYLEHGAFWAILALAIIMYAQTLTHIPEVLTGLIGATFIGLSFWSSVRHNKAEALEH
ncbi:DUF475 domain-containing protein [Niveispirillum sp. BGYR6]|uniref:DUF475 domain-containing protein n=1 Tax=Niveispirillum sp. BGYR6 TaxID=2971249 RepID=UPI0022B950C6|nr:DUF475 domain-containing protein [Niveispirillum sp. BGYR6]MDG5493499.1 DUF475 domain-containing protein [Niveispirillum sp. BGYR6]